MWTCQQYCEQLLKHRCLLTLFDVVTLLEQLREGWKPGHPADYCNGACQLLLHSLDVLPFHPARDQARRTSAKAGNTAVLLQLPWGRARAAPAQSTRSAAGSA